MAFREVLAIPETKKDWRGREFIPEGDLSKLTKANLLFFSQQRIYKVLSDFPAPGGFERRLTYSEIKGPFESPPQIEPQKGGAYAESEKRVLELLVPSDAMPVEFQPVTRRTYGTMVRDKWKRFFSSGYVNLVNKEGIIKIEEISKYIKEKWGGEERVGQYVDELTAFTKGCLIEAKTYDSCRPYPYINIDIFGEGENPLELMNELRVERVGEQFSSNRDISIRSSTERGLAYLLSLSGKETIHDVLKLPNVII